MILCLAALSTAFWIYEEIYYRSSDISTEKRAAIEIMDFTAKQKGFDPDLLKGPIPNNYSFNNREFAWTLNNRIVVRLTFTYVPHDYAIVFEGSMSRFQ